MSEPKTVEAEVSKAGLFKVNPKEWFDVYFWNGDAYEYAEGYQRRDLAEEAIKSDNDCRGVIIVHIKIPAMEF